jgi:hypothetical protein
MCVFLLLSGKRYVAETAHVRVHQISMGDDRANDAKDAAYTADDLMIVGRDPRASRQIHFRYGRHG